MSDAKVITIGTSAGGVEALQRLVSGLPADFSVPVLVVQHVSPEGSVLPQILSRAGALPARHAMDGERITGRRIYVAPPDFHMTVHDHCIRVVRGPRENRNRPAIDPLFKSAAKAFGGGAIGVILTGLLDDGTAGLKAIKRCGGTAIVQDPKDALYTGMPLSAIEHVAVDHVLPLAEIPSLLTRLSEKGSEQTAKPKEQQPAMDTTRFSEFDSSTIRQEPDGTPASFSCPDCHGTLWENNEDNLVSFRCRTGHSFTPAHLMAGQAETTEESMWDVLRGLEEQAALFRHLAASARERKLSEAAITHLLSSAEEKDKAAMVIREMLLSNKKFLEDEQQTG